MFLGEHTTASLEVLHRIEHSLLRFHFSNFTTGSITEEFEAHTTNVEILIGHDEEIIRMEKPEISSGSRELQCVGRLEVVRPKPVGFLCGSLPVPTDKAFLAFNSALVPSSQR